MYQKYLLAVFVALATLASVTAMNMVPSAFASNNGESEAPGQGHDSEGGRAHQNPSDNQPPPGQDEDGNPGQSQKFLNGPAFDIEKEQAHDESHVKG